MKDHATPGRSRIQTVLGVISAEDLGYCQCHEHLFIAKGKSYEVSPSLWMDDLAASTEELHLYRAVGGRSLVDAQPVGCGRLANYLIEASQESGINIIASTGFHKLVFYEKGHWIRRLGEDTLSRLFISELEDGMFIDGDDMFPAKRCRAKAGIIKTAVDSFGISDDYIKLFSAAANTSLETGFPILCHIEKGADALKVVEFLTHKGIKPESVILCHLDRVKFDPSYHKEVASTGAYLEYDTIARFKYHGNETEIKLIQDMISGGYGDRLLLGLDTTRERLRSYGADIGLDYIRECFVPLMLNAGIAEKAILRMTIENPMKALSNINKNSE